MPVHPAASVLGHLACHAGACQENRRNLPGGDTLTTAPATGTPGRHASGLVSQTRKGIASSVGTSQERDAGVRTLLDLARQRAEEFRALAGWRMPHPSG